MHFDEKLPCIQSLTQDVNWRSIYVLCPEVLFLNADLISFPLRISSEDVTKSAMQSCKWKSCKLTT